MSPASALKGPGTQLHGGAGGRGRAGGSGGWEAGLPQGLASSSRLQQCCISLAQPSPAALRRRALSPLTCAGWRPGGAQTAHPPPPWGAAPRRALPPARRRWPGRGTGETSCRGCCRRSKQQEAMAQATDHSTLLRPVCPPPHLLLPSRRSAGALQQLASGGSRAQHQGLHLRGRGGPQRRVLGATADGASACSPPQRVSALETGPATHPKGSRPLQAPFCSAPLPALQAFR